MEWTNPNRLQSLRSFQCCLLDYGGDLFRAMAATWDDNMTGRIVLSSEITRERHVIGPSGEVRAVGVDALCDMTGRLYAF